MDCHPLDVLDMQRAIDPGIFHLQKQVKIFKYLTDVPFGNAWFFEKSTPRWLQIAWLYFHLEVSQLR